MVRYDYASRPVWAVIRSVASVRITASGQPSWSPVFYEVAGQRLYVGQAEQLADRLDSWEIAGTVDKAIKIAYDTCETIETSGYEVVRMDDERWSHLF